MRKRFTLALLSLLLVPLGMMAQNVTVRGDNGSVLAARKTSSSGTVTDTFYDWGGFATWKHNQLSLTMTTADSDDATLENGLFKNPANNIFKNEKVLQLGCGISVDTYVTFCLPKGYRFRGYTIVFSRDIALPAGRTSGTGGTIDNAEFGETNSDWSWMSNATHKTGIAYQQNNATEYTITRSIDDNDCNILYFKLTSPHGRKGQDNYRAFITLKSVELLFTAEADYTPVMPQAIASGASAVDIPFNTSKVDYGKLESKSYANYSARMGYDSQNVKPLSANLTLYEKESVTDSITNPFDKSTGRMVKYETSGHSIYSAGSYFKLGGKKGKDETGKDIDVEQVYFLETPNYVEVPDGNSTYKNPVGYRIVGAEFEYTNEISGNQHFYITYNNGSLLYLNTDGQFTTSPIAWEIDADGYISSGSEYLVGRNQYYVATQDSKPNAYYGTFEITDNGIRLKYDTSSYLIFYEDNGFYGVFYTTNDDHASVEYVSEEGGNFTLRVYDKTGKKYTDYPVSGPGKVKLDSLNNDAVKIGVIGTGYVRGSLTMQALDPYIDRLNIVCQEASVNEETGEYSKAKQGSTVSQQFTATDFSVKGGKFNFYVPENFNFPCIFTFENLYSQYGDKTYYGGITDGNSRYNFVMSPYWEGNTNVYQTDPDHVYTDKIWTENVGAVPFVFNNADSFSGNNPSAGIYKEYPFNPAEYGDGIVSDKDNFTKFVFSQSEMSSGKSKIAYLFTCDETRYNIAPTTGIQHTAYAYYEMEISMQRMDYKPVFTWEPIYDKTCFQKDGKLAEDAQWGLKLTTDPKNTDGTYGYLTVEQITDAIKKQAVEGATNGPTSPDQILYVDGSDLQSIVENETKETTGEGEEAVTTTKKHSMSDIKTSLGANALVFLPEGTTTNQDNFAYKTVGGLFRGANNFVLTDMKPFYSPYDFEIEEAKQICYPRMITLPKNGKVTSASIILPFILKIDESGQHSNIGEEAPAFKLHQMQAENCLLDKTGDEAFVYFPALANVTETKANVPYIVEVLNAGDDDPYSFVVTQNGTWVYSTDGMDDGKSNAKLKYTFVGESASGSHKDADNNVTNYNFTSYGSYSGKQISKNDNVFYFAKNMFLSSEDLVQSTVKVAPFRSYYATGGSVGVRTLNSFDIIFGEGEGNETNGINTLTSSENIDINAPVYDLQGRKLADSIVGATLKRGIYVINGVKFTVK